MIIENNRVKQNFSFVKHRNILICIVSWSSQTDRQIFYFGLSKRVPFHIIKAETSDPNQQTTNIFHTPTIYTDYIHIAHHSNVSKFLIWTPDHCLTRRSNIHCWRQQVSAQSDIYVFELQPHILIHYKLSTLHHYDQI